MSEVEIDVVNGVTVPLHETAEFTGEEPGSHAPVVAGESGEKIFPHGVSTMRLIRADGFQDVKRIRELAPEVLEAMI